MQKYIEVIQPSGETFLIRQAVASNFEDALSGEMTLSFTVKMKDLPSFSSESVLRYGGQYFRISSFVRSISNGEYLISVEAEHESFVLSDKSLDLEKFEFSGSASDALALILSGTGMAGYIENDVQVEFNKVGTVTRRSLLKELVSLCGGELEYEGHDIKIVNHRGSSSRYDILAAHPTADLTVRNVVSGNAVNYKLLTDCSDSITDSITVGDEVRLKVGGSFQIDVDVRVISVSYDIFNCVGVTVQMGDYSPDITDSMVDGDEKLSDIEEALTDAVKKSDLSASIDTYINSEEGKASIVLSLSGTYVTEDVLSGYTKKVELSAEIGAYIDTHEGTAKIINALSGTYVTSDELGDYVEKTELQTEIGSYIDTQAGTAKIISACSGTYQTKAGMAGYVKTTSLSSSIEQYIDSKAGTAKLISAVSGTYQTKAGMTDYVKTTELNTTVAQYIDSKAGTAKIVSACSGTYQTISGMSDYAKVSAVTSIEQSVSDVEASITLSSSYSKNTIGTNVYALLQLVSNANSSSIKLKADKIDFTGFTTFLRASDLGSGGKTTIDGGRITTGTISADRIDVSKLKLYELYAKSGTSDLKILSATGSTITFGGQGAFTSIEIYCGTTTSSGIKLGVNSSSCIVINPSGKDIHGVSSFSLGTTAYPWKTLYVGTSASSLWTMDETGLIPSSTTLDRFNIGSDSKRVNKIYGKELSIQTKVQLGTASTSTLGFFGTTPAARQTVANTATVATLITALKKYGLIA